MGIKKQKSLFLAIITSLLLFLNFLTPISAFANNKVWSTTTPLDTYNRPDLSSQFDILRVEVGLWDSDLDQVHFWIQFKNSMLPSQFNDGMSSWAGILIDTNGDDKEDLRIETRPATYSKNYGQPADASSGCTATTWMNLDAGVENVWLGFKVSQKCIGLPNKFRVQGYADYKANDNSSFDYAPDAFATIDLGDYYNPKPKVTTPVPFSTPDYGSKLANYSSSPENLATLASKLRDSVVTIECVNGDSVGTGTAWAAKVLLPNGNPNKSYLITNYHVISDCIFKGSVDVILNDKTKVVGQLSAWDPDNDLAGIYISRELPPLLWNGELPLQGSWAGVLGSPKGLPGVLTTGIVSSINSSEKWITFTAPINPGNSGGPVFDSVGRVMAVATAKARDSEGFGIGNGVPLLCEVVIRCASSQSGWQGISAKISSDYPKKSQFLTFKSNLATANYGVIDTLNISDVDNSSSALVAFSSSGLIPNISSETPGICIISGKDVRLVGSGTCILRAEQNGSSEYAAAESKRVFIGIYFTKKPQNQEISFDIVPDTSLTEKELRVRIYATSGLEVDAQTENYNICSIFKDRYSMNEYSIILNDVGTCEITLRQKGNSSFYAANEESLIFEITSPKKSTITCTKGKVKKKIRAINPKCPKGYKQS